MNLTLELPTQISVITQILLLMPVTFMIRRCFHSTLLAWAVCLARQIQINVSKFVIITNIAIMGGVASFFYMYHSSEALSALRHELIFELITITRVGMYHSINIVEMSHQQLLKTTIEKYL